MLKKYVSQPILKKTALQNGSGRAGPGQKNLARTQNDRDFQTRKYGLSRTDM
jgi:hypothetical protein